MANSLEDTASGCLGQILVYGLIIMGIGWVIKWVCLKIVENAGAIVSVIACVVVVFVAVVALKGVIRRAAATRNFREIVDRPLENMQKALDVQKRDIATANERSRKLLVAARSELSKVS